MTEWDPELARRLAIAGRLLEIRPFGRGHIHQTLVSRWQMADGETRLLHQKLNEHVFPDVQALSRNIDRVTRHLASRGAETLQLVPATDGELVVVTPSGTWRTLTFLEDTEAHDRCRDAEQAFDAARMVGAFQRDLVDFPAGELTEILPGFFEPTHHFAALEDAVANAASDRKTTALPELEFATARRSQASWSASLPVRVVHGDTKLNNILFDRTTGRARALVDLDTCMPGWSLYDFGDLVRFTAATSAEDETDLERVGTDPETYRALAEGYLETATFLSHRERGQLLAAARLVTLTIGVRFLADFLRGDTYFRTHREMHNLDRARVQFRMVAGMEADAERLRVR